MSNERELTELQKRFLDALFNEAKGNVRQAMASAGYSPDYKSTQLIKTLKDEIVEHAKFVLAANAPNAVLAMVDILHDPVSQGCKEKMRAAEQILDRIGVVKSDKVEIENRVSGSIFFLPAKQTE